MTSINAKTFIEDKVATNQVVIFSKTYCPYCMASKKRFQGLRRNNQNNATPLIFELDKMESGTAIQDHLYRTTGQSTVPSVWINGKFVGGNSDTEALMRTGELERLLLLDSQRVD
jgi:glutaredoxin 3